MVKEEILQNINTILKFKSTKEYDEFVSKFEKLFAKYCDCKDSLAVNSGTSALQLALLFLGIKEGNEVLVPAYTYAASAIVVSNIGAIPVFVDIKPTDLTIDPKDIESKITNKTKAIIAVHIHGNPCDIDPILEICKKYKLNLIEDASQAHGATYKGKKVGSFGVGCFSLHMSKNLGAFSSAGAITFNADQLREKLLKYVQPDNDTVEALNSGRTPCEMDAIQACFLIPKLKILDKMNDRKREIAKLYDEFITNPSFEKPVLNDKSISVYRDYFIMCKDREKVFKTLLSQGIGSKIRYKKPLHLTNTFKYLGHKESDFPVAEKVAKEVLCLPTHLGLSDEDIIKICSILNKIT